MPGPGEYGGEDGDAEHAAGYGRSMNTRVLILGAGFGGLELSTMLAEAFGGDLE
jgi:hypothetical protein